MMLLQKKSKSYIMIMNALNLFPRMNMSLQATNVFLLFGHLLSNMMEDRAKCVAGGHVLTPAWDDKKLSSRAVNLETILIAFVVTAFNFLDVIATDISSIYIQALTIEKVYDVIAGPEFGQLKGRTMLVIKALYGLKIKEWSSMASKSSR
jgi:hypothetical protein